MALEPAALFQRAADGHRGSLARALSLVERGGEPARTLAALSYPSSADGYTVGLTGAPGAGKSTLTGALLSQLRAGGVERIGVLAIDPSSPFSGGAILGDRVRMQDHALDDGVFIRSLATRGHLGGLALAAPVAARLMMATGRKLVLIETVGVGQVEVEIAGAADTTVVVVNPGWGDAVQANKAGLMEIADVFVINKSDRPGADDTERDLNYMLDLSGHPDWRPPICRTVASEGTGLDELAEAVDHHRQYLADSGEGERRRRARQRQELRRVLDELVAARIGSLEGSTAFDRQLAAIERYEVDPWTAATEVVDQVLVSEPAANP